LNPLALFLATLRAIWRSKPQPLNMHSVLIERRPDGFRIQPLRTPTIALTGHLVRSRPNALFVVRSPNMPSLRRPTGAPVGVTINERYLMKPAPGVNPRLN